nr:hypothetical protein CFP56_45024 [Quercus suber]
MSVEYGGHGTMLCCWFAVNLIEEELVEEGREDMTDNRERGRQSIGRASMGRRLGKSYGSALGKSDGLAASGRGDGLTRMEEEREKNKREKVSFYGRFESA